MNTNIVPITEAKAKLPELVRASEEHDVVLLRHGRPAAVLVGVGRLDAIYEEIEDLKDRLSLFEARAESPDMRISHDKLMAELGMNGLDAGDLPFTGELDA